MRENFPDWLEDAWQRLLQSSRQGRLAHALLITGQTGIGKRLLAERLAGLLLCEQPVKAVGACDQCQACRRLRAGSHPDLVSLRPEETGKAIKIDQVRALGAELAMTSHAGGYKIAVIEPADAMNVNAANSLLKTLEEPTARTLLILLTASPGHLPATVRSRCQRLQINTPSTPQALDWLQQQGIDAATAARYLPMAAGAPRLAAEMAGNDLIALRDQRLHDVLAVFSGKLDPLRAATDWQGEHAAQTLLWWQSWLQALIRWRQAGRVPEEPQVAQMLQQILESVDCKQLFELMDRITRALNSLGSGLNRQLLLEDLLIDWARLAGRPSRSSTVAGR